MPETQTQDFFHEYAGDFNAIYSERNGIVNNAINKLFRRSMELRYQKTLAGCDPVRNKTVLDIGCGPGHYGIALANRGAAQVTGIDFADGMIELARQQARSCGVIARCEFFAGDFNTYQPEDQFDFVVVMGFMDYVAEPLPLMQKAFSLTRQRAFFSFPADGGLLAWQRKLRYRYRCPLFLYRPADIEALCAAVPGAEWKLEPISRDFFVTLSRK